MIAAHGEEAGELNLNEIVLGEEVLSSLLWLRKV